MSMGMMVVCMYLVDVWCMGWLAGDACRCKSVGVILNERKLAE